MPEIDVDELADRLERGDDLLVDVRRPDEWDEAHIGAATLITLDTLPDHLDELPRDRAILVICRSGARSAAATEALRGAGYDATNVAGGMLAWIDSGRDVATGA
ncbi:rhodanese-like domain-containing protein [Actinomarinicola tropica]|uniref:Rhodanese-like domain-containing protein n=1 Tax=Actinomarinicola tropica TaxID=2789776 RepID=A0A5Q2RR69_9ACTN|nr:rhodanese-like domain-containing protein [Actinomarinicola tropica]